MSVSSVDLSTYVLVNRYDLPEPTRTTPPDKTSLLAQEVSAVTYNWDTGTLFVVGDGGTSIVQVTLTGKLIDSMTLAPGASPQGTEFYDTEGLTYIGGGKFVMTEERDRNAVEFTYAANTMLTRDKAETVHLGTFVGNVGLEGLTWDPQTGGFIFVKEKTPEGIFQTMIDFTAHTPSNGTPGVEPTNLFDPALVNLLDFADIYALSNIPSLKGQPDSSHLLVLSQESGKIVEVDRAGNVYGSLTIVSSPGNPLSVADQQHEGLTMDSDGNLYVVSENGGGDFDHPQVWVYAPSSAANLAPSAIALTDQVTSIAENTNTATRIKVATVAITDDGLGTNNLSVSGADAGIFEVDSSGLYIKAGTKLDFETRTSYSVVVNVDDPAVGSTPDASTPFTLKVTDVVDETPAHATLFISEVAPWSSGNSPVAADWFEVTNSGSTAIDITGWKMDDNSDSFASAVALSGITSIAAGESVIFIETADLAAARAAFLSNWFGGSAPAGLQIGSYNGSGVGLSTGGDHVNLFDSSGALKANVAFGASPAGPFPTFDNSAGVNNATITALSTGGVHGAIAAASDKAETGSPGTVGKLFISEVAPWSSGDSPVGADWFEVTNTTAFAIDLTGWKMDDSSGSPAAAVALSGITSIAAGESVIFIETADLAGARAAFINTWFGGNAPAGLQIGSYSGAGVGLSTSGDAVNLYDSHNALQASVTFGASPASPFATFDNAAALNNATISQLSVAGTNGAFVAANDTKETGSPGQIAVANHAPMVALTGLITSIAENTSTAARIKVASVTVTDDGLGTNNLSVSGADAGLFEVDSSGLYIKAGTVLDFETKTSYSVTVNVDDPAVGNTPDSSAPFTLTITDVAEPPAHPTLFISEVAPWSSGNSPVAADWFEVTNTGTTAIDITGWKMDDNSDSFASAVALSGITSIAAGESVIFIETADLAASRAAFLNTWFGGSAPAGLQIGSYNGSGVGLSTGGDHVNLFDSSGALKANVAFGASPAGPFPTFDNSAGLNNATITALSTAGVHGAIAATNDKAETGSPGTVGKLFISEVAPWSSGNSPVGADWFEVTNTTAFAIDITGWKMDDSSGSAASAVALSGITSIAAGESVIFIETADLAAARAAFINTWFGGNAPAGLQIGSYSGAGVGLSTSGDAVNLYDSHNALQASVTFGASPAGPFATFDNAAALNGATISTLSTAGVNGAFIAAKDAAETGSPGEIALVNQPPTITSPATANVAENTVATTIVYDAAATDPDSATILFSLTGADAARFSIDAHSGEVRFLASPDFETPLDAGGNNVYDLIVHANDGTADTTKAIAITVTNVSGETWAGGNQGETHTGTGEEDTLTGGTGNDTLIGAGGNDTLDGGGGVNTASYTGASKNFEVSIAAHQQAFTVKDRLGAEGQDTVSHVQLVHFADQTLDATILAKAANLAPSSFAPLIDLYSAYLHRAPDALGLDYWASRLSDGMSLSDIAKSFFASAEAVTTRPAGQSFTALVTSAYNDILDRAPDTPGLNYWVAELQAGRMTLEKFALAFVGGAHAAGGADAQTLANKENVGAYYAIEQGLNNVDHARAVLGSPITDAHAARGQIDGYAAAAATSGSAELVVKLVGIHADEIAPIA
jgi:uncharacterized protein YjiK